MTTRRQQTPETCHSFLTRCFRDTISTGRSPYSTYDMEVSHNNAGTCAVRIGLLEKCNPNSQKGGTVRWAFGDNKPTVAQATALHEDLLKYATECNAKYVKNQQGLPTKKDDIELSEQILDDDDDDQPTAVEVMQGMAMTLEALRDCMETLIIENKQINVKMDAWKEQS